MKRFINNNDPASKEGFVLETPDYVESAELSGTAVQVTVPAGARYVVMSASVGDDFYAKGGADPTATIPGTATTNGSGSFANPAVWRLDGVAKISVIGTCKISLAFFA